MINALLSAAPWLLGVCVNAVLLFVLAIPLLIGLSMAIKMLRYREWLAILAVAASMAILVGGGDFLYNLIYWTSSFISPPPRSSQPRLARR